MPERANPDLSKWHAPGKRALAIMEETVGSLRIAKINDDGTPDPFVVECFEPSPLPVREKRPSLQGRKTRASGLQNRHLGFESVCSIAWGYSCQPKRRR